MRYPFLLLLLALAMAVALACAGESAEDAAVDADEAHGDPTTGDADGAADEDTPDVGADTPADSDDTDAPDDARSDDTDDADEETDAEPPPRVLDERPAWVEPPACGTGGDWPGLIPAPGEDGHDAELAAKARRIERQFHAFNALGTGVNADLGVSPDEVDDREMIRAFLQDGDAWDFEAWSGGIPATDVIGSWAKVAGAYAGVGMAADAFRYATLLREGAPCDELERARAFIVADLDALHLAQAITGVEGVIARGFAHSDYPGEDYELTPLFDDEGNPLPEEKNNGTWRADNSGGSYPDFTWEDSCSRDMLIGWAVGFGALWEVIRDDPAFDSALRDRMQADATAIARSLMTTQASGYDLEIRDADGRMTYHGILHPESLDRAYLPGARNGFNALMALGILGALAYVAAEPDIDAFIYDELIDERDFLVLSNDFMFGLDLGHASNFSMYNMVHQAGWLATRYLRDPGARAEAARAVRFAIYDRGGDHQPREMRQTFFDLVYTAALTGQSAFSDPAEPLEEDVLAGGMQTLVEWSDAPYWELGYDNCDDDEIASRDCIGEDGTPIHVLGTIGRNDDLVAEDPIPMRIRPGSNYWWRSNPYKPNGAGGGGRLLPGSDFRIAYWMARYLRRTLPER